MKRALIISTNLIGDTLCAGIAIREFFRVKKDEFEEIDLITNEDHITKIYEGLGVEWTNIFTGVIDTDKMSTEPTISYQKIYKLGAGDAGKYCDDKQCHIVEGFCNILGIEPPRVETVQVAQGTFKAWKPEYNPWRTLDSLSLEEDIPSGLVLFSPFSASCSSRSGLPANKMIPSEKWLPIINFLRTLGPIRMLGAPDDRPDASWQLSEEEIMTGVPLDWLAAVMKKSKLVITIDNGMGHLAASQDAKHILLYPMCLGLHFILPWGANYTVPIQIEPTQVAAAQLMWSITRATKHLVVDK